MQEKPQTSELKGYENFNNVKTTELKKYESDLKRNGFCLYSVSHSSIFTNNAAPLLIRLFFFSFDCFCFQPKSITMDHTKLPRQSVDFSNGACVVRLLLASRTTIAGLRAGRSQAVNRMVLIMLPKQ